MIKKILLLVLALTLTASLVVSCGKNEADGFKPENFDFTLRTPTDEMGFEAGYHYFIQDDGSVLISSADLSGDVVIPSELGGKTVTAIGEGAFFKNESITSVVIPDTVETIGIYAFADCSELKSITVGEKVWRIAPFAFDNTPWLASQTDEFVTVGDGVLIAYNGTSRTPVLPDGVRHLGGAFSGNPDIRKLTLGRGVLTISDMALSFCSELVEVDLGLSLVYAGDQAFSGSEKITALVFPDTLRYLGSQATMNCYALKYVYLGKSLTALGSNTFEYAQALRTVFIPKTLTDLRTSHFTDCMSLSLLLYEGTEEEFNAIAKNDNIANFRDLTKVFNYNGGANE